MDAGNYSVEKSTVYFNPLYKSPNFFYTTKYIYSFYYHLTKKAIEGLNDKLFSVRYNCWTLFIGKGNFLDATLFRLKPVKLPKDEFWTDPFIFNHKGDNYVLFENYNYKFKKGKISCGKIKNNSLIEIRDVLEQDYHLSYPYIFMEDNEIYLMPETRKNNKLEIYRCVEFSNKWKLFSTAFEGEQLVDAFFTTMNTNKDGYLSIKK